MKNKTSLYLHLVFVVIAAIELAGRLFGDIRLEYAAKPLIMIWMASYFLVYRMNRRLTVPVLLAFFFSWTGDLFLMFSFREEMFFYAGVGGFFFAQIAYMYLFLKFCEIRTTGYLQQHPWHGLFFLLYLVVVLSLLVPRMEGIMVPVIIVYALSLIGMSMAALNRKSRVGETGFRLVFAGSVLFVASDTMIALNKFVLDIPMAGFWIMATYMAAQYLIMRGLVMHR